MAINQEIVDQLIEHRAFLLRYERTVASDLLAVLARGEDQAIGAITKAYEDVLLKGAVNEWDGTGIKFRVKALDRVRAALRDVFADAEKSLRKAVEGITTDTQDELINAIRSNIPAPAIDEMALSRVPERQLAAMLDARFGDRLTGSAATVGKGLQSLEPGILAAVDRVLQDGVRDGVGMRAMQRAARKVLGATPGSKLGRDVSTYARTMVQTAANDVAGMIYRENNDIVRAEQYIATLDDDTCPVCGPLDGQVFGFKDGKSTAPRPPRHPNCRCFMSPVLKDWAAMGLKGDVSKDVKRLLDGKPATKTKWSDWVQANPDRLKRVLGPSRADLVESGNVPLKALFNDSERGLVTLKKLAERRAA